MYIILKLKYNIIELILDINNNISNIIINKIKILKTFKYTDLDPDIRT